MKFSLVLFLAGLFLSNAQGMSAMKMRHGFILASGDRFATHLVATGPHSWQSDIAIQLQIPDSQEAAAYSQLRKNDTNSYFLFMAQNLDLPALQKGQVLSGPIVECEKGKYEPDHVVVKEAQVQVDEVLISEENPFFTNEN